MEDAKITIERWDQFDKKIAHYGFGVVTMYSWKELFSKIILALCAIPIIPIFIYIFLLLVFSKLVTYIPSYSLKIVGFITILFWIFSSIYVLIYIARIFGGFIIAGKLFYTNKGRIFAGKSYMVINPEIIRDELKKNYLLPLNNNYFPSDGFNIIKHYSNMIISFMGWKSEGSIFKGFIIYIVADILLFTLPIGILLLGKFEFQRIQEAGYSNIIYFLLFTMLCVIFFFIIITLMYRIFNPLYAFGNLGEKIQKLTPRIEEQSKQIQSEFQSDMNFSVLSDGFDSLSATFSEIVTLVIKLENVETRANKGNLFDSEKYINSLRLDIVTPLTSLKTFLEKQKTELMKSQKELTRVRVGGSEGTENMELQSKRSESLIQELTENIEKLDVMIGKMGK